MFFLLHPPAEIPPVKKKKSLPVIYYKQVHDCVLKIHTTQKAKSVEVFLSPAFNSLIRSPFVNSCHICKSIV